MQLFTFQFWIINVFRNYFWIWFDWAGVIMWVDIHNSFSALSTFIFNWCMNFCYRSLDFIDSWFLLKIWDQIHLYTKTLIYSWPCFYVGSYQFWGQEQIEDMAPEKNQFLFGTMDAKGILRKLGEVGLDQLKEEIVPNSTSRK